MNNPIIEEIRDTKNKLAAAFDYDLNKIFEDANRRDLETRKAFDSKKSCEKEQEAAATH